MKIREYEVKQQGLGGEVTFTRVTSLSGKSATVPEGAKQVPDDTPESDWHVASKEELE